MKKTILAIILAMNLTSVSAQNTQEITRTEALKYIDASADYFTGKANFAPLPKIPTNDENYAIVNFDAGTINNWHTHSQGQYLIITEGEGRVQEWGKPVQIVKKGDVVWCPPNVKHWHGAGEKTPMSHIAIIPNASNNKTEWLEKVDLPKVEKSVEHIQKEPLTQRQLAIVPIASLIAMGEVEKLNPVLEDALAKGMSVSEIKEIFVHIQAYVGFPRALNGLITFNNLLKSRAEKGINDPKGKTPNNANPSDFYRLGEQTLRDMGSGAIISNEPLFGSEGMDYALKANLFGYLFSRDNLSFVDREIVVVSALSVLGGVDGQLSSHLRNTNGLGVNKTELDKIIKKVKEINKKQGKNAEKVLNKLNLK